MPKITVSQQDKRTYLVQSADLLQTSKGQVICDELIKPIQVADHYVICALSYNQPSKDGLLGIVHNQEELIGECYRLALARANSRIASTINPNSWEIEDATGRASKLEQAIDDKNR